jgi:hypothetical protein
LQLILETQYHENYGDEENPHWKAKGGQTYIVDLPVENANASTINELKSLIDYRNPMSEEYVNSVHLEEDGYISDYEKWQCLTPLHGVHYDTRVALHEDGTYVATDQFKGPRGNWVKIWNMLPGGEKENYSFTRIPLKGV